MLIVTILIVQHLEGSVKQSTLQILLFPVRKHGHSCPPMPAPPNRRDSRPAGKHFLLVPGKQVRRRLHLFPHMQCGGRRATLPFPDGGKAKSRNRKTAASAFFVRRGGGAAWSWQQESNLQPADYKSAALPIELCQRSLYILAWQRRFVNVYTGIRPVFRTKNTRRQRRTSSRRALCFGLLSPVRISR